MATRVDATNKLQLRYRWCWSFWSLVVVAGYYVSALHLRSTSATAQQKAGASVPHNKHLPLALHLKKSFADVVIVGAGAAGLFASGAATMLGKSVALLETSAQLGGDCTNAACVPSKALRAAASQQLGWRNNAARDYILDTVQAVREREDPKAIEARNTNNKIVVHYNLQSCRFVNPHELEIIHTNRTVESIQGQIFVIATGAGPIVPDAWKRQAAIADLPLFTYKTVLKPELNQEFWAIFNATTSSVMRRKKTLAIIGGGATACELGQTLAKLGKNLFKVKLIAPAILPLEDRTLRDAARSMLLDEGVEFVQSRLVQILPNRTLRLRGKTKMVSQVDGLLVCVGRSPRESLSSLRLEKANVAWTTDRGVTVNPHTLQSTTQRHIFAVGDCSSAVPPRLRTASQAAWTGFHAIRNAFVPWILRVGGARHSVHPCVPRVIYTEPELACVGLTQWECEDMYGDVNGFDSVFVREEGSDRADMDRTSRNTNFSFLELRAVKGSGRILGLTCCGPAAAEMANSIGMAITNRLTVRDVARSVHSYPSHGYLLHRAALSMALSDAWGLLEACGGPVARFLAGIGRFFETFVRTFARFFRRKILGMT
ncbi:hypothetical protein ACA910_021128 [Epithemia clementina (nom. ined.)]